MASFEETYFDVLKAIETAIVSAYALHPNAKDRHANEALGGLIRTYNAALKEKKPPTLSLDPAERAFYDAVRLSLEAHMQAGATLQDGHSLSLEEAVLCLKRIVRSIEQMMSVGGIGGSKYLDFVRDYQTGRLTGG